MLDNNKRLWLEKFDCFSLSGKDAKKFLNGITTANIINSNNQVCKTCWLTPNGVLRALIEIVFFEQELNLVILEGNKSEIRNEPCAIYYVESGDLSLLIENCEDQALVEFK